MIAAGLGHTDAGWRNVVEIVIGGRRQFDSRQRMQVIVFARHEPGHVRLVQADRQKKRLVVLFAKLIDAVLDRLPVGQILVGRKVQGAREANAADPLITRRCRIARGPFQVVVPFAVPIETAVIDLDRARDKVAGQAKRGGQSQCPERWSAANRRCSRTRPCVHGSAGLLA